MEVFSVEADATEAIVAFGEVSAQDEIGAVAAAFGAYAISAVGHRGAVHAMNRVVAQFALGAVCALIAVLALAAEGTVCAASTFFTAIADGVDGLGREVFRQEVELLKKFSAVHVYDPCG